MKVCDFSQLVNTDFDIQNITVTPYEFSPDKKVEYKLGRKNNLLHIVTFGTRYYNVDGKEFEVGEGGIIFIPRGTSYSSFTQSRCCGTGVCFDITGTQEINLQPGVYVDWKTDISRAAQYIKKMEEIYITSPASVLSLKAMLFMAINTLAKSERSCKEDYLLIKPAVEYIGMHYTDNCKILQYAALCNMSESYFRKKFVECMGISPIGYRNELRFALARRLYSQGKTLQEIAELTGFYDAGFFSKAYKKQTGGSLKNTFDVI